ncbi:MAG: glycosyltransferase, partial [Thermoanaerobaculia bacterium]
FWRNRLMLAVVHWPPALLARVFYRALVTEILSSSWSHNALQRRALRETLGRLPRLLRQRWRSRGRKTWRRFLHPPGSVPVITLPEIADGAAAKGDSDAAVAEELLAGAVEKARALRTGSDNGRRVLVLGWSPLPFQNQRMNYAPGVRAWQLAKPLADDGHGVCLVCGRIRGAYDAAAPPVEVFERDGVLCVILDAPSFDDDAALAAIAAAVDPEVVIGASPLPSRRAARIAGELPLWVDLFGDPMAEAQAKAAIDPGRDHVAAYRHLLIELLDRGDAFGAVSERQKYAVIGQLGLAGRLGADNAGHQLVDAVPCCTPPPTPADAPPPEDLDTADFVVLWSGGYNTWGDVDTLFVALERAMAARPELRFVSTGGEIDGHDESSYGRFTAAVETSKFRDRFVFKGRLQEQEAGRYFRRANLGVVTERELAERLLGSSGRVLRWMADGLPFVCTRLSELGETVAAEGLGWTYPPGDADALADLLIAAAEDPPALRATADRAGAYAVEHLTAEATTRPLRRWVAAARPAPDRAATRRRLSIEPRVMRARIEELEAEVIQARSENQDLVGQVHGLRAELGTVHQSRMWRLWMIYLRLRRLLLWPFRR